MKLDRQVRLADIIAIAADVWGITEKALTGAERTRSLVHARATVALIAKALPTPASYPAIGKALGGRDHSSIMNLCDKAGVYASHYPEFEANLAVLFDRCAESEPFARDRLVARRKGRKPRKKTTMDAVRDKDRWIAKVLRAVNELAPTVDVKPRNRFLSGDDELVNSRIDMRRGSRLLANAIREARAA